MTFYLRNLMQGAIGLGVTGPIGPTGPTTYPSAGIAVSTGTAWGTSKTSPTGNVVGTTDTQTLSNKTLSNVVLDGSYTEDVYALTGTALDPANGTVQTITLSGNTAFTDSLSSGQSMIIGINDGTNYTVTWPTITWTTATAAAPTLATSGYTWVTLWKVGTTLYGKS